jgi:diguanylate cyclase (GGDEF)-like protein/PAS domain S-box-containing protein
LPTPDDGPFLQALLDGLPLGALLIDRDGTIRAWNPRAERVSGHQAASLVGGPLARAPFEGLDALIDRARAAPDAQRGRLVLRHADGRRQAVDLIALAAREPSGAAAGAVVIFPLAEEPAARLLSLARTDPLTGLANRRALDEALDLLAPSTGLVLIDLDDFKRINDRHGHPEGDRVLALAARALRDGCRPEDLVGRYGGDEFLIVLAGAGLKAAANIAERLRAAVKAATGPPAVGDGPITVSAGVAEARSGEHPAALLARLDAALYQAKARGGDRVARAAATSPTAP